MALRSFYYLISLKSLSFFVFLRPLSLNYEIENIRFQPSVTEERIKEQMTLTEFPLTGLLRVTHPEVCLFKSSFQVTRANGRKADVTNEREEK